MVRYGTDGFCLNDIRLGLDDLGTQCSAYPLLLLGKTQNHQSPIVIFISQIFLESPLNDKRPASYIRT